MRTRDKVNLFNILNINLSAPHALFVLVPVTALQNSPSELSKSIILTYN